MVNEGPDTVEAQTKNHSSENVVVDGTPVPKHRCFVAGVVVWAKIDGFPMWPAVIRARSHIEPALREEERSCLPPQQANTRLVEFFNDDNNIAVVDLTNMDLFTSDVYHLSRAGSALRTIISEACTEAETFILACGLPFQRNATFKDNHRPRSNLQVITTNETSHSDVDCSSEEDLDMPLAALHIGKVAAPGAPILRRKAPPPSETVTPSRSKTRSNSDTNENNGSANSRHYTPLSRFARPSNNSSSPRAEIDEEDVIGPTPEGHPPWTTPLSVLSNSAPRPNGAQTVPITAGNAPSPSKTKLASLPMKLRLRNGATPEKAEKSPRDSLTPRRRVADTLLNRRSKKRARRSVEDDNDDDELFDSMSDGPTSNGIERSQENGSGSESLWKRKNRASQAELECIQDDVKFVTEQAGSIHEFANRLSRVSAKLPNLLEETNKLQAKKTELQKLVEQEEENFRTKKKAVEAQNKILDRLKTSVDEKRKQEKKATEDSIKQKAMLEDCKTELGNCNADMKKAKELERKHTEEAKAQKQIAENYRVEVAELKEAQQKLQRRMKELNDEVVGLRDERRELRKLKRGSQPVALRSAPTLSPSSSLRLPQPISQKEKNVGNVKTTGSRSKRESTTKQSSQNGTKNAPVVESSKTSADSGERTVEKLKNGKTRIEIIEAWGTRNGGAVKDTASEAKKKG